MLKLSIIIPGYNCERTLREAFESCYRQGLADDEFEVVMVDDGSTDGTRALMETLAGERANVRLVFHEVNRGGGAARNSAARAAAAPVIFCLDSDDVLPPDTLRKMHDFLLQKNADGVGLHYSTKFNGTDPKDIDRVDTFACAGERIPLENLLQKNNELCSLYSVFMFTRAAFAKAGGYPEHHGFDTQGFAWRFLAAGLTAYVCPETNYLHRINFHQSYCLREYKDGKLNINWQDILLEHEHLLTPSAREFIRRYPVRDFTRNLFYDLCQREDVFLPEADREYGKSTLASQKPSVRPVPINSPFGLYYRLRNKLRLGHVFRH
jgi:glycosyltransferase involved in cell wall biosynthesis